MAAEINNVKDVGVVFTLLAPLSGTIQQVGKTEDPPIYKREEIEK
jgi:hypothetical protein